MSLIQNETVIVPFSELETTSDKENCAHIVKTDKNEDAVAKVLEARIYGLTLEALCGHRWVPSRDPKTLPVCEECKSIYETYKVFNDGLNEGPTT